MGGCGDALSVHQTRFELSKVSLEVVGSRSWPSGVDDKGRDRTRLVLEGVRPTPGHSDGGRRIRCRQGGEVDIRIGEITTDIYIIDRHHPDPWVLDLRLDESRQLLLDQVGNSSAATEFSGHLTFLGDHGWSA